MGFGSKRLFYSDRQCNCYDRYLDAHGFYRWVICRPCCSRSLSRLGHFSVLCATHPFVCCTGELFTKGLEKASSLAAVIFPPAVAETFVMADAAVVDKVEIGVISIGSVLIVSDANSSYDPDWIADQ